MKIVCITLARHAIEPNSLLPLQLLAIAGDLMDAGHNVIWVDELLHKKTVDKIVAQICFIDPDVLLFAYSTASVAPLLASIAVKADRCDDSAFICDEVMQPANKWRDTLSDQNISVASLLAIIKSRSSSLRHASNSSHLSHEPETERVMTKDNKVLSYERAKQ